MVSGIIAVSRETVESSSLSAAVITLNIVNRPDHVTEHKLSETLQNISYCHEFVNRNSFLLFSRLQSFPDIDIKK